MNQLHDYMDLAIGEARTSLREGNSGFGAVLVRRKEVISRCRDTDKTSGDPTAHAEMNAIREASAILEGDFSDCLLVSTHEPCPMCASAIAWAGIRKIAYGYSIREALKQGRRRINLTCSELFKRAGASVEIVSDVKKEACSLLYNQQVRREIKLLRNAGPEDLERLAGELKHKRICWYRNREFQHDRSDLLELAYHLFLTKLGIRAEEAPVVERRDDTLVIHSKNFCPTLEACRILGLDTREVCRRLNEEPTQALLQQLHPNLRFSRNYDALRPHTPYCEEMIILKETG